MRDERDTAAQAGQLGLDPAAVSAWRLALIDMALRDLPTVVTPLGWVELEVELVRSNAAYTTLLRSDLISCLREWMLSGAATNAWYIHKPPGLRIRVEGDVVKLRHELAGPADRLVETGAATGWRFGHYLPEGHLFGGTSGLRETHRLFSAESAAVLTYYRARCDGRARVKPVEFSLALLLTLACLMVPDRWERWGVWCDLGSWGRLAEIPAGRSGHLTAAIEWVHEFVAEQELHSATPEETAVLSDFRDSVSSLVRTTSALGPVSTTHPRLLMPAWTVFHWNRMGFPIPVQRTLGRLLEETARPPRRDG